MNAFHTENFLKFSSSVVRNLETSNIGILDNKLFPYHIVNSNKEFLNNNKFIITPICFSGPVDFDFIKFNASKISNDIAGGFIQTRTETEKIKKIELLNQDYILIKSIRTNYRIIIKEIEDYEKTLKRDSKYRLKKLRDISYKFDVNNISDYELFIFYYIENSIRLKFSNSYVFSSKNLENILQNKLTTLLTIKIDNNYAAGVLLNQVSKTTYDYTFIAINPKYSDINRLLIYKTVEYLNSIRVKNLDLGGGINENDSLAKYKISMGGEAIYLTNYKFLFCKALKPSYKDIHIKNLLLENEMNSKWP